MRQRCKTSALSMRSEKGCEKIEIACPLLAKTCVFNVKELHFRSRSSERDNTHARKSWQSTSFFESTSTQAGTSLSTCATIASRL